MLTQVLEEHLSRYTTGKAYYPEIDGLRFMAILVVFLGHLAFYLIIKRYGETFLQSGDGATVSRVLHWTGSCGVFLFFVISGFILSLPFARAAREGRRPRPLKSYMARRLTRLEPPYVLCMVCFAAMAILVRRPAALDGTSVARSLGASLLYIHGLALGTKSPLNLVTWSLEIEVQFYLLAPLLAVVYRITDPRVRRAILVVAIAASCFTDHVRFLALEELQDYSILGYLEFFMTGMLLADLASVGPDQRVDGRVWDVIFVLALLTSLCLPRRVGGRIVVVAITSLVFTAGRSGFRARRFLSRPLVRTLGGMCYSIYLWHPLGITGVGFFTMGLTATLPPSLDFVIQAVLLTGATLALSILAFVLVERPCMKPDWPARLAGFLRPEVLQARRGIFGLFSLFRR